MANNSICFAVNHNIGVVFVETAEMKMTHRAISHKGITHLSPDIM